MFDRDQLSEKATRDELTRVFDVCSSCRRCIDLCDVFPTLFDLVDAAGGVAGQLAPFDQDRVVDGCVHCRRCVVDCPFATPATHEPAVDVPRTMIRATAMRVSAGQLGGRHRRWVGSLRRPRRLVRLLRIAGSSPSESLRRRALRLLTGMSADRDAPTPAVARSGDVARDGPPGAVIVPTCVVDAARPGLVDRTAEVLGRRGVGCSVVSIGCCGAASLHAGDVDGFVAAAHRTVGRLADVPDGASIVVLDPTCAATIAREYPSLEIPGAERVAARVVGPSAAVLAAGVTGQRRAVTSSGDAPRTLLHVGGHAQWVGDDADRRVLEQLGHDPVVLTGSTGLESPAGLGATADRAARSQRDRLGASIDLAASGDGDVVTGGLLGDPTLTGFLGRAARHPIDLVHDFDLEAPPD